MKKNTNNTTNIGYFGEVTVQLKNGKKTISKYTYHNNGKNPLFKFIAEALAGNFNVENRPCKLKLFSKTTNEDPSNPVFSTNTHISQYIMYGLPPVPEIINSEDDTAGYKVTYHFVIPNSYIFSGYDKIYKLAIYPAVTGSDPSQNICATFLFTNAAGTDWDPQAIRTGISNNYVLVIDWTMTISNKTEIRSAASNE